MEAQTLQNRAQIGPRGVQDDQKIEKEQRPNKEEASAPQRRPIFPKMWPTWLQVGSQVGAKMDKKSMQKSIKNLMHLGIDFW